jgi:hypothetical protein
MKNLHLIPTDKPSRLVKIKDNLFYTTTENIPRGVYQHLYTTNNEVIKEGDYVYRDSGIVFKITKELLEYYESIKDKDTHKRYKIILTTDTDLIADGVQAIDDEFLEWFVKNPSCESVEVDLDYECALRIIDGKNLGYYSVIIPKEEPTTFLSFDKEVADTITREGQALIRELQKHVEQETLEEAAENWNRSFDEYDEFVPKHNINIQNSFIAGAKWQAERMYSEEEVHKIIKSYKNNLPKLYLKLFYTNWFQQFKK